MLSNRIAINTKIVKANNELPDKWFTTSYCQIEPAMAFQIGLPILILREKGVVDDGLLEKRVTGLYLPEIDIDSS